MRACTCWRPCRTSGAASTGRARRSRFAIASCAFLEHDVGLSGLEQSIRVERRYTPLDFRDDLSSHLGSAFSIEPTLLQSAYFRPHNVSEDVDGLYLVGAGTHPGAGIPGVLLSARITSRLVQESLPRRAGHGARWRALPTRRVRTWTLDLDRLADLRTVLGALLVGVQAVLGARVAWRLLRTGRDGAIRQRRRAAAERASLAVVVPVLNEANRMPRASKD